MLFKAYTLQIKINDKSTFLSFENYCSTYLKIAQDFWKGIFGKFMCKLKYIGVVQLWVQTFLQEGPDMSANFITGRSKYECKLDHRRVHIWVQTSEQVGPNMSANLVTDRSIYECKLRHKSVQIWVQLLTQEGPNMSANIESSFWRDSSRNEG